jgi:SAM-dependent methyltransferase
VLRSLVRSAAKKGGPRVESIARRAQLIAQTIYKSGGVHRRECPICSCYGYFTAYGDPPRWDARCPKCGSFERHRLLALALGEAPGLVSGRTIHFAPERGIACVVRPLASEYQSADTMMEGCDLRLNIEQIDLPDESVDTFIASHILEHVDDRKALSELRRCLRPGGRAIIMVPIVEAWRSSHEDKGVTDAKGRLLHFGQSDHIRYYGSDLRDRIRDAGFILSEFVACPDDVARYGLMRGETVFVAQRVRT